MGDIKEIRIIIISTIIYGITAQAFINIPYMSWGTFGAIFFAAFVLCWMFNSILYITVKIFYNNTQKKVVTVFQAFLFGFAATLVKMGLDAVTEITLKYLPNMLIGVLIMEVVILLYGMAVMLFLMIFVGKRKIKIEYRKVKMEISVLIGCAIVYMSCLIFFLFQLSYYMEKYSSAVAEVGEAQVILNFSIELAKRTTFVGMVVFVIFYIIFWCLLTKSIVSEGESR